MTQATSTKFRCRKLVITCAPPFDHQASDALLRQVVQQHLKVKIAILIARQEEQTRPGRFQSRAALGIGILASGDPRRAGMVAQHPGLRRGAQPAI